MSSAKGLDKGLKFATRHLTPTNALLFGGALGVGLGVYKRGSNISGIKQEQALNAAERLERKTDEKRVSKNTAKILEKLELALLLFYLWEADSVKS